MEARLLQQTFMGIAHVSRMKEMTWPRSDCDSAMVTGYYVAIKAKSTNGRHLRAD